MASKFVHFYCADTGQTTSIHRDHIQKISDKPAREITEKWCCYVNLTGNSTVRVMDSREDAVAKVEAAYL